MNRIARFRVAAVRMQRAGLLALLLAATTTVPAAQVTVDGRDFVPLFGNTSYGESSAGNLICTDESGVNLFTAQLPLPPVDLTLKQLAIWGGDFASTNASVSLVRYCQAEFTASTPTTTLIASVNSSGDGGNYFDSTALNRVVDDQGTCVYMLQAQLGLNDCPGNTLSIARVRVRYDVIQAPVVDAMFGNGFEN
jgi:hypothetical protein